MKVEQPPWLHVFLAELLVSSAFYTLQETRGVPAPPCQYHLSVATVRRRHRRWRGFRPGWLRTRREPAVAVSASASLEQALFANTLRPAWNVEDATVAVWVIGARACSVWQVRATSVDHGFMVVCRLVVNDGTGLATGRPAWFLFACLPIDNSPELLKLSG